nr:squalene/phytoene synthase family protein [Streptomyces sp. NRRL B-24572]
MEASGLSGAGLCVRRRAPSRCRGEPGPGPGVPARRVQGDRDLLRWSKPTGCRDPRVTDALRAAAALTQDVYREAEPGVDLLDPVSAPCVRTALVLYREIMTVIEKEEYTVLHRRAGLGARQRGRRRWRRRARRRRPPRRPRCAPVRRAAAGHPG